MQNVKNSLIIQFLAIAMRHQGQTCIIMSSIMIKIFPGSLQFSELEADTDYIVGMGLYQMRGMEPTQRKIRYRIERCD